MPQDDLEKDPNKRASHLLGKPLDTSYGTPGSYEIAGEDFWDADPRVFHEIGQSTFHEIGREEVASFSKTFDANPPRLTGKINYHVKGTKLVSCAQVYVPASGTTMLISVNTPLKPIQRMLKEAAAKGASSKQVAAMFGLEDSDFYEIGWSPYKWAKKNIKSAAKSIGKKVGKKALDYTVNHPAFRKVAKKASAAVKYMGREAEKVAQNPYIQKFATGAAVAVGMYYGVPPNVTMAATSVLFDAINGNGVALDKVANVAQLAASGYAPAQKMKAVMKTLYEGGMKDMIPYLEKAQAVAQSSFAQKAKAIAQTELPTSFRLPNTPASMFPFNLPGVDLGPPIGGWIYNIPYREESSKHTIRSLYQRGMDSPKVSGWFYNKPYRSNLAARSIDTSNPFHLLRGAYSKGLAA